MFRSAPPCLLILMFLFTSCPAQEPGGKEVVDDRPVALRVLTFRQLPQDADLVAAFEQRRNLNVEVEVLPAAAILERAASGAGMNADVVIMPSLETTTRLREYNVLQPFFVNSFTNGDVADIFIDNEGYYSGLTRWTMATFYNPNAVTSEEAGTYKGVMEAALRGIRVGVAHPDSSGLAGVIAGVNAVLNPTAAEYLAQGITQNANGGAVGSDYHQLNRMLAGELDMVFVSSGALFRWILNGDPTHYEAGKVWRILYPQTGATGDNMANMTCLTVTANSPHRQLALDYIDYLYERPVQEKLTSAYFENPAQSFAEADNYLHTVRTVPGRTVPCSVVEENLPAAWGILER